MSKMIIVKPFFGLLVPIVGIAALYLPRRSKELTVNGNPLLRYYGPSLLCLVSAVFWIGVAWRGLSRGETQQHPDDLYVNIVFIAMSAIGAIWFLIGWRRVLTDASIEHRMWPFPPLTYNLRDVVSVRRAGTMNANPKSAAFAGAWAALGLVPFDAWIQRHDSFIPTMHNLLWLIAIAVFFAVVTSWFLGRVRSRFAVMGLLIPSSAHVTRSSRSGRWCGSFRPLSWGRSGQVSSC